MSSDTPSPSAGSSPVDPLGALAEQLWRDSVGKQLQAVRAIGEMPGPAADDLLIKALGHGDEWVAAEAARVLGARRTAAAVPALIKVLGAQDWLANLEERRADWKAAENAGHAAVALAQYSGDLEDMQEAAAVALESIGTDEARRAVVAWRESRKKN